MIESGLPIEIKLLVAEACIETLKRRAEKAEKELADLRAMVLDGLAEMERTLGKPESGR